MRIEIAIFAYLNRQSATWLRVTKPYILLVVLMPMFVVSPARAGDDLQASAVRTGAEDSVGITRQQADEILKDLSQIIQLLKKRSAPALAEQVPVAPPSVKLSLTGAASLGSNQAPVAIVEFMDVECFFCRKFYNETLAEIRKRYVETGKVRFAVLDLPSDAHANAMRAAEALRCAGDQGKYWAMYDTLFSDRARLDQKGLSTYAETLGLEVGVFQSCIENEKHKSDIKIDVHLARSLQIDGTPSFLIGNIVGQEVEGSVIVGNQTLGAFEEKLKEYRVLP